MKKRSSLTNKNINCWSTIGVWSNAKERCDRLGEVIHCRNCDIFSNAGRGVLENRAPASYIAQWQMDIAKEKQEKKKGDVGAMVFRLGMEWLALPVENLQEIVEEKNVHKIPHNKGMYILGIVNIGGEINTCYSLMNLLEIDDIKMKNKNELHRLIVIVINGDRFVFPVCEINGLTRYSSDELVPYPATLGSKMGAYLLGIFNYQKQQVAVLNVEQIYRGFEGIGL